MNARKIYFTQTALKTLRKIGYETEKRWGKRQAKHYLQALIDQSHALPSENSKKLEKEDESIQSLSMQRIQHHYVAFRTLSDGSIAIGGFLHERMDLPNRLKELQGMSQREIHSIEVGLKTPANT